jgi:hypothetical protein
MKTTTPHRRGARAVLALTLLAAAPASASHFRGAAMIPVVDASGRLTLHSTTFWAPNSPAGIDESANPQVADVDAMTDVGAMTDETPRMEDTSDSRFTKVTQSHTIQLPGPGLYAITAGSCCRVGGILTRRNRRGR